MTWESKLEKFKNKSTHRDYTIRFVCPEFTCLCPKTGFPDFAIINIEYQPNRFCIELKSLKLYINSYRDKGIFHEDVSNKILDDLVLLIQPKYMKVFADFNVRGNIHTTINANYGIPNKEAL